MFCYVISAPSTYVWNVLILECRRKSSNHRQMGKFLLTFVRHGETEYNKKKLLQGQIDIPLNETGMKQADALGRYLARERFDRVYSSDLSRCVQTAEGFIRNAAVPRPNMVKDARLRERNFGEGEGLSREERASKGPCDPKGAETRKQVVDRALSFLHDLCLDVHKEYGHQMDDCSEIVTGSSSVEEGGEIEEGDSFEVVFAGDNTDASADGACSNDITQNSTHGTVVSQSETVAAVKTQKEVCGTEYETNTTDGTSKDDQGSQHGTTSEPTLSTTASGSTGKLRHHPIFKSDITGISDTHPNSPHIFVSAHGYILRALFQTLQKQYKMIDFAGGKSILRGGCPNTGLSTFVFTLDSDGLPSDVECYFVYAVDHLEGIEYIHKSGEGERMREKE